jgi:hypothetical protein
MFFQRQQEALDTGKAFDQKACRAEIKKFEEAWCGQRESFPSKPQGDSVAVVARILEKYIPVQNGGSK